MRRRDPAFLRILFESFTDGVSPVSRANLRKIDSFAWLAEDRQLLLTLSDEQQRGMVNLMLVSGVNRLRVFDFLRFVLERGSELGRRAACEGLGEFKGANANQLVCAALDDQDPIVQARAVRQIRERGIPGALNRLVELVDSPHEVVRTAACGALTEFNFQRYLSAFDLLAPEVRRTTGELVKRIDRLALEQLRNELVSPSRSRRLRGLEVAVAMNAVAQLDQCVFELAQDSDHFIRSEAARALIHINTERSRQALHDLLLDRSVSVQQAAARSLEQLSSLAAFPVAQPPPAPPGVFDLPDSGTHATEAMP
jgi:HEAT repeat protein